MDNKTRFLYNGLLLTAVNLLMRGAAMFFGAYVSRAVGAEGVGLYSIIMTVYSFGLTLASSGIGLTVTRHVAGRIGEGEPSAVGKIMRGAAIYAACFGLFATVVLYFGSNVIVNIALHDTRAAAPLRILSLSLLPSALSAVLVGYFIGVKKVASNAASQILSFVVKIVLTVTLLSSFSEGNIGKSVFLVCLSITLSEIVSLVVLFVVYIVLRAKESLGGIEIKPVAKDASALAISAYVRSALVTLEHVLIPRGVRKYSGDSSEALSSYGALHGMALPLVLFPMSPLSSFSGLLVPELAESKTAKNEARAKRICSEAIEKTLSYAAVASIFIFLFAEELGYAVYSSYDAGRFIALLAPVVPIMYLDHVTDSILKGIGEQVYSMWVNISDSLLSVVLVIILIPRMGISGYALVIIVMEAYNFIMSYGKLRSKIKFKVNALEALLSPTLAALASAAAVNEIFVMCSAETGIMWLALKIIFAISVFVPLNAFLSFAIKNWGKSKQQFTKIN